MKTTQLLDQILNDFSESKNQVLHNLYNNKYQEMHISQFMSAVKRLFDETLLEHEVNKSKTEIDEWTTLAISLKGLDVIKEGGYEKVYESVIAKQEEKENLELQQLKTNVMLLTNQLSDYDAVKRKAIRADIVSILTAIVTVVMIVIELIKLKTG